MNIQKSITIFSIIFFLFFYSFNVFASEGVVINVHDGDTVTIKVKKNKNLKIRLLGIDAPELNQPYGHKSRLYLTNLLKNKKVTYKTKYKDTYGRLVGEIFINNENINLKMIKSGYAWHYKSFYKSEDFAEAEINARKNKVGLWQDKNPVPPWDFRKRQKNTPNVHNKPFIIIPYDIFLCINPNTAYWRIQLKPCSKGLYTIIGSK